ncbi:MAG: type II secretion system minor pseudopilin GspI [Gammaproteobacteria bacterium]|nr:type II secretion system minor pseudopilin GspI [Gammaproteobacteria bacterium]MDH3429058.1 type II secretion system minor pseudopilin GspI [Gammaproteobacteria bacterium]MDH3433098.1 type II secretion system minor pseudopilin GspI [Gammaproteobacteria bacterium]
MSGLRRKGFTLVEVMVALAIIALSLTAVAAKMGRMIDTSNSMRERTYASWIAQNKIAELRLANVIPEVTATSGEVDYANTIWRWRAVVSESGIENLFRVDVSISYENDDAVIRTVTGFIGEPVIPGQSNRSWDRGSENSGARE